MGGNTVCGYFGCGTVFKLDPATGTYTVLYNFGQADGEAPQGGVIRDQHGNLYGATAIGGKFAQGTVFGLYATGREVVLHSFTDDQNGYRPFSGVIGDEQNNLYGTTAWGGDGGQGCQAGCGVVFQISATGIYTVLHSFSGSPNDGGSSYARLLRDASGNLYGTTVFGGPSNNGTVFKVAPDGTETVLHSFSRTDGSQPSAGLIADAAGNLYGVTPLGGTGGYGSVFKIDASGVFTPLYSFTGKSDGGAPYGQVFLDPKTGNLFGSASSGGYLGSMCNSGGCGLIFEISPSGQETVLHYFTGGSEGSNPGSGLIGRPNPHAGLDLFGTTGGVIFKLSVPPQAK